MLKVSVLKQKFNFSYLSKPFHLFIFIVFAVFSLYTYHRICENFNNVRLFFNNTDQAAYVSLHEAQTGELKLVTRHPKKISFIIKSDNTEELKADDFNVSFDEIPLNLEKHVTFFEGECYLVVDLPVLGFNSKNKLLHYNIQSDRASLKFTDAGVIIHKQSGTRILYKFIVALVFFPFLIFFFHLLVCSSSWKVENKFLVITLAFGMVFIFGRPPCSQYDEVKHFDSAYNMSNIIMGLGNARETKVLLKRQCDMNLWPGYNSDTYYDINYYCAWYGEPKDYFLHLKDNLFKKAETELIETPSDKVLKPQRSYLFAALVITVMRLIGANQFVLFYAGAIFNLLIAAFLIFFSIRKNKVLQNNIILILSSFPVVIAQLGSYSYDAILLPFAFALINYSIDFYYSKKRSLIDLLIVIGLCIFVFPIKAVYFLLSFYLLLTYLFNKYKKINLLNITCVLVCCYVILYLIVYNTNIPFFNIRCFAEGNDNVLGYSISEIVLHPFNDLKILADTLIEQPYDKIRYLFVVGNSWKPQVRLMEYLLLFLFVSLFFIEKNNVKELHLSSFVVFIIVGILIYAAGIFWTKIGSPFIWGVQPRYFLPVLPLLFISTEAVRTDKIVFKFNDLYDLSIVLSFFSIIHCVLEIFVHYAG